MSLVRRSRPVAATAAIVAVSLCGLAAPAGADAHIGLYLDEYATVCGADVSPFVPVDVLVIGVPDGEMAGVTAAEFRIDNYPGGQGTGSASPTWSTNLVIGDVANGIALAFQQPQTGGIVLLGRITFLAFADSWVGANYRMAAARSFDSDKLILVSESFEEIEVWGGTFTFNCQTPQDCECARGGSKDASWGVVKSIFK